MARTASSVRDRTPYRSNRRRRWLSIVFSERPRDPAASAFDAPAPTSARTAISRSEGRRGADRTDRTAAALKVVPPEATVRTASRILAHGGGLDEVTGGAALERARIRDGWSKPETMTTAGRPGSPPAALRR